MKNELLLAKSNIRKKKGVSIGISILMFIASFLVSTSLLLLFDAYPGTEKYAKKLNAGDGDAIVYNSLNGINENSIHEIVKDDVLSYEVQDYLCYNGKSVKYGEGDLSVTILLKNSSAFSKTHNQTEIVTENNTISSNYIYLPYQFYTAGGYEIGDKFNFDVKDKTYNLTVRGFINNTLFGCTNAGALEMVTDDLSYETIKLDSTQENYAYVIIYKLNEKISSRKFGIKLSNALLSIDNKAIVTSNDLKSCIYNRGFMSLILAVSFITITSILCLIIVLMLVNCISNFIKESMKEIGALKAIGYTSKNIRSSIMVQFLLLSLISSILGICGAHLLMPSFAKIVTANQGIPYVLSFSPIAIFVPFIFLISFVALVTLLSTLKIKKIEPIIALRDGMENHNFKKNRFPLDKAKTNINLTLSLKTLFTNLKQNIITFIVTGFLTFITVLGVLMYENFNRNPMLEILTFETFSGLVAVDYAVKDDAYQYLQEREEITNVKRMINYEFVYGDNDDTILVNIVDDVSKFNNLNIVYDGRFPKYDNEIVLSGKFAKEYNYAIGDMIELGVAGKKASYLISGLLQTCNNNGREALISEKGAQPVLSMDTIPGYFWFDCDRSDVDKIIDDFVAKYGDKFITSMNFYEIIDGAMTQFKNIAVVMLVACGSFSAAVIILVIFLLIKSLMHNKKKEFGVLKALGYKNKDLMIQTAVSFMPSIILSALIFSFVSYYCSNSYMNLIMLTFGLVKCNFVIPPLGVAIVAVSLCLISFLFAIFESRKVKNIEPYNLLIAE